MAKHLRPYNEVTLSYIRPHVSKLLKIKNPITCIEMLREISGDGKLDLKEYHWVFLLTADNKLLGISEFNTGTIVACNIFIREILQLALVANAVGIVLIHNHPSGSLSPSKKDYEITQRLKDIGKVMEINLRDHLIITSESYISMRPLMNW